MKIKNYMRKVNTEKLRCLLALATHIPAARLFTSISDWRLKKIFLFDRVSFSLGFLIKAKVGFSLILNFDSIRDK